MTPLVTVVMPTYGRPELLNEAVHGFLAQTWHNKRLIIGNDCADQHLVFDHPQVMVVNRAERFATLGEKRNWLIDMASPGFVANWDDDDVYLPQHIEKSMAQLPLFKTRAVRQFHCWRDGGHDKYRLIFARYMHTIIADRAILRAVPYSAMNLNEDHDLIVRLLKARHLSGPPQSLHEPTFINCMATGRAHMTDFADDEVIARVADEAKRRSVTGRLEITPTHNPEPARKAAESWEAVHDCV